MAVIFRNAWGPLLEPELAKPYYQKLRSQLADEYRERTIYPDMHHIFQALHLTSYEDAKVVILGQDPYHGAGQAHGLSFSVLPGVRTPPSLQNIYKELRDDLGCPIPSHGYLEHWARQGVLLLNAVLTVREGQPNSHRKLGWEAFTSAVIAALNEREQPLAFILWGRNAQEKASFIDRRRHLVVASAHPSPLSAHNGFFGSRPFSRVNAFLREHGMEEIDWRVPELDEQAAADARAESAAARERGREGEGGA